MAKKKRKSSKSAQYTIVLPVWAIILIIAIVLAAVGVYYFVYMKKDKGGSDGAVAVGEFSVHVLMLGNKYNGDCVPSCA